MNKQRKVVITTTYNEMGIIIDTKAEEVTRPNLQPTCNGLATDCISRLAAIDVMCELMHHWFGGDPKDEIREIKRELEKLPSAQPDKSCDGCRYENADDGAGHQRGRCCRYDEMEGYAGTGKNGGERCITL